MRHAIVHVTVTKGTDGGTLFIDSFHTSLKRNPCLFCQQGAILKCYSLLLCVFVGKPTICIRLFISTCRIWGGFLSVFVGLDVASTVNSYFSANHRWSKANAHMRKCS